MLKIVFMGTPDIAKLALERIYESGNEILAVVTTPDTQKGRGMKFIPSPVKEYAIEKGFKIYQPEKIRKNTEFIETIKDLNPDVICVVAYGKILPKSLLEIPKFGCINIHPSLLPKYRGPAPIQWAVLNGDKTTGVSIMYLDEGMDTGDIIIQEETKIEPKETTGNLWNRLSIMGANLIVTALEQIEAGTVQRRKQEGEASIAPMLDKEISKINWEEKTGENICNLVRGLNPIMGAYSYLEGKKIKFWDVEYLQNEDVIKDFPELEEYLYKLKDVDPGTVLFSDSKKGLFIKAIDGIIKAIEIQPENSKRMNACDYLRGNPIEIGKIFE